MVYNDKMYIFGGNNNVDNAANYDQLYSLDFRIEIFLKILTCFFRNNDLDVDKM